MAQIGPSAGFVFAALTVLCWASFNVAAKHGVDHGFTPAQLSLLRFGVAGLVLIPVLVLRARRGQSFPPLWQIGVLSLLGGPIYGVVAFGGYQFAPLSHGLLFAPAAVFLVGTLLGVLVLKEGLSRRFFVGTATMMAGLMLVSGFSAASLGPGTLTGDALFLLAGCMWAVFTTLMRRWRIDPITGTLAVGSVSSVLAVAVFIAFGGAGPALPPADQILIQAIMQGLIGGVLSVFFFLAAINALGAARASLLPAMTPGTAMALSFVVFGTSPTVPELVGIVLVTAGLVRAIR